ncbi:uncharacterized protein Bfra_004370 [Botrytis fragariae]|uniref:Uncharacterized protein n=1 Tax=Botrytis fragariae TaxID=1964551 RepID=A0A8H6EJP3_9HELO|nr:uncharacterized protein Bfra_004370 [Botrytis fragariae]KAF5874365.1 hypothetical protein Bfra_004370 [Botrytis fragariae]
MAAQPSTYTRLAESHTHPTGEDHKALHRLPGLLKSGITPITPPPYENYYKHKAHQDLKWYQSQRFGGFTTQELHLHDAFAPYSNLKATGQLTCPIHPILQRSKWRRQLPAQLARYPLGNGREGYWDAWENDTVWNMMVPSLQLTTMFMANLYTWPWFDALFFGEMEEVDPVDLPPELRGKKGYQRFKLRRPEICAQANERMRVQEMLERFRDDVILDLSSGHTDTRSGLPDEFEFANTNGALDIVTKRGIGISMAFEILEPFFNAKITEAERMIVSYRFAATLLHELCHAFWDCLRKWGIRMDGEDVVGQNLEPWFEHQRTSELGFSMESFVFGGIAQDFLREESVPCRGIPPMGFYLSEFDKSVTEPLTTNPLILIRKPPNYFISHVWPITLTYFIDIQSQLWWNTYKAVFGPRSTHIPKLYGKRTINRPDGLPPEPPAAGFETIDLDTKMIETEPKDQIQSIVDWFRNSYKQRAHAIRNAIIAHGNLESSYLLPPNPPPRGDEEEDEEYNEEEEEEVEEGEDDDEEIPSCPRYDEIKNYLINQKRELAIDTMRFRMPEHTLHQYIRRNGGIDLSAEEWREFLLNSSERKELFQIRNKNGKPPTPYHAILRTLSNGWPTSLPAPTTPMQVRVSGAQVECFSSATRIYLADRKEPWYRLDFWDADLEIFLVLCNNWMADNNQAPLPRDIFEACIRAGIQPRFVLGPKGIIRKLPGSPPQPKKSKKRSAQGPQLGPPSKHRGQNCSG